MWRASTIRAHRLPTRQFSSAQLQPGETLHNFSVVRSTTVPRYDITAVELQHRETGARWLHVDAEDRNNAFAVGFSTSPSDSTGVAHVLEHQVLCGSAKFPVR